MRTSLRKLLSGEPSPFPTSTSNLVPSLEPLFLHRAGRAHHDRALRGRECSAVPGLFGELQFCHTGNSFRPSTLTCLWVKGRHSSEQLGEKVTWEESVDICLIRSSYDLFSMTSSVNLHVPNNNGCLFRNIKFPCPLCLHWHIFKWLHFKTWKKRPFIEWISPVVWWKL